MNEQVWAKYGLEGLIMLAVITLLFIVIKWTLATTKEILEQAAKEREAWHKAIAEITARIERHDEKAEERGRYSREEHKQMIEVLGRINGYRHE